MTPRTLIWLYFFLQLVFFEDLLCLRLESWRSRQTFIILRADTYSPGFFCLVYLYEVVESSQPPFEAGTLPPPVTGDETEMHRSEVFFAWGYAARTRTPAA